MKYLIISLCDSSVSFCNYERSETPNLISIDVLESALIWGIKNNLNIQILYPRYELPCSYQTLIDNYEHIEIRYLNKVHNADIWVVNNFSELEQYECIVSPVIVHISISEFLSNYKEIGDILPKVKRLNICFTDVHNFTEDNEAQYECSLNYLAKKIEGLYIAENPIQLNLITDRTMLTQMNNCNAGIESITVAPDGNFYICPAFYLSKNKACGNIKDGVAIPNQRLLAIENAPICRLCDAFHCRRCVHLNKSLTNEVNTPSRQQCIMSHIERRASKILLDSIRSFGQYAPDVDIPQLDYNDPFDKLINQS